MPQRFNQWASCEDSDFHRWVVASHNHHPPTSLVLYGLVWGGCPNEFIQEEISVLFYSEKFETCSTQKRLRLLDEMTWTRAWQKY